MRISPRLGKIDSSAAAAGRVVLIYAVLAALWILTSDTALEALVRNPDDWARVGMFKGLLFVAATALLLYVLLIRLLKTTGEAQQALAAHYAKLIEQARDIVLLIDPAGRIVEANRAAEAAYGYPHAELLGMMVDDLRAPDSLADVERQWTVAASTEGVLFETRHRHRDGRVFPVEVSSRAIEIDGKLHRQSFIRDISERKQAQAVLQEKERLLVESQRIAHIGGWSWAFTGPIQWTDETYRLYGVSSETFTPTFEALVNLVHPEDRPLMQEWTRACGAGEKPAEFEFRCVWPDGTVRLLNGRGERINNAEDRPTHIFGTVQDITERKQAQIASEVALSRLQAILDALPDLLFEVDSEGRIFSYHTHRSDLLAAPPEVFMGKRMADVLPPEAASACQRAIDEAAQNGSSIGETFWLALPQGEHWFELSVSPLHTAAKSDQRFIMISRNITERKHAEEALTQQLDELRRWQKAMIDREDRIITVKQEVNELLSRLGQPVRYPSVQEKSQK